MRILRIARFAARFSDFSIAETLELMRGMVAMAKSTIWSPSASGRNWPRA